MAWSRVWPLLCSRGCFYKLLAGEIPARRFAVLLAALFSIAGLPLLNLVKAGAGWSHTGARCLGGYRP